VKEGF
jgi:hypothetical protein